MDDEVEGRGLETEVVKTSEKIELKRSMRNSKELKPKTIAGAKEPKVKEMKATKGKKNSCQR